MKQDQFKVYHHSSADMRGVPSNTVDLAIIAPPYNIGTNYGTSPKLDEVSHVAYTRLLTNVIKETARVLKNNGKVLVEAADTIYTRGKFFSLAAWLQTICLANGLKIVQRNINFTQTNLGVELTDTDHGWKQSKYYSTKNCHSNAHQWLIFFKTKKIIPSPVKGKIFYINYPTHQEKHPCPFSYLQIHTFLNLLGFKTNMTVLEPFMGTGRLGAVVVKSGGKYIGYETELKHYKFAYQRLTSL